MSQPPTPPAPPMEKLLPIRLVVFDVDGTLTAGGLTLGPAGEALKTFSVQDGLGLKALVESGIAVAIITSRSSAIVERRAEELGIEHVIQGAGTKGGALEKLQGRLDIAAAQTAAMGDDLPDLALFARSALRLAPRGAVADVLAEADWVSTRAAGEGAAREAAELILRAQGRWRAIVDRFRHE